MFSDIALIVCIFLVISLFAIPIYVRLFKDFLYEEWSMIWQKNLEAEKRKLTMVEVNKQRKIKKTK